MDVKSQEAALKKKLQSFLQELQRIGTVKGFKHFTCFIRGREELLVSISNTLQGNSLYSGNLSNSPSRRQSICHSDSLTSSRLPYDKGCLVLSHNTQVGLSGMKERGVGLPPASPSEQESALDPDVTLFLIAGYARYSCPYVWVRSNHERLLKLSGDMDTDKDSPLRLKSTVRWKDSDVQVTDIIAEVVRLCTYPAPRNPFEVDLEYFHSLSQPDQLFSTAAMVNYLQKIVIASPDSNSYAGKVFEDLQYVAKIHFTSLNELIKKSKIPVLQQQQKRQSEQQRQQWFNQQVTHSGSRVACYSKVSTPVMGPPTYHQSPITVCPTTPTNTLGYTYGEGPTGDFPGGFSRMPAPSLF